MSIIIIIIIMISQESGTTPRQVSARHNLTLGPLDEGTGLYECSKQGGREGGVGAK